MTDENLEEGVATEVSEFDAAFKEHADAKEPIIDSDKLDENEPEQGSEDEQADTEKAVLEPSEDEGKKEEVDPYAGFSEDAKARIIDLEEENKALNHRVSSDSGRVSAFQRQVTKLEKEIKAAKESSTDDQPSNEQISSAMSGTDDDWESFKEDYPDVASAIDRRLELAGKATQESVNETLAPVKEREIRYQEDEAKAAEDAAVTAIREVYPTWTDEVKRPEFTEWLNTQPPGISSLAMSDDPADAGALIGLYDGHLVAAGKPSMKKTDPGPGVEEESEKSVDTVAARRARQLEDGTTVASKPARINPGDASGTEFEAAFDVFAKRREAARRTA